MEDAKAEFTGPEEGVVVALERVKIPASVCFQAVHLAAIARLRCRGDVELGPFEQVVQVVRFVYSDRPE